MIPESQREFRFSVGILSSCKESNLSPLGGHFAHPKKGLGMIS